MLYNKALHVFFKYNQQDATSQELFISAKMPYILGGSFAHHQELKNCIYSIGYFFKPLLLPATVVVGSSKGFYIAVEL